MIYVKYISRKNNLLFWLYSLYIEKEQQIYINNFKITIYILEKL